MLIHLPLAVSVERAMSDAQALNDWNSVHNDVPPLH